MPTLPVGTIALLVVTVLVYFGLAQRLLDRMRLNDRTTLLIIGAMVVGTYLPPIPVSPRVSVNIGGALIPAGLALWLWFTADEKRERWRAFFATLASSGLVYVASIYLPTNHDGGTLYGLVDPMYAYALIAGLTAYLLGRSRRASFIAGALAIVVNDVIYTIQVALRGMNVETIVGGAGVFDTVVIAALLAVLLAELIGETRERLSGGHPHDDSAGDDNARRRIELSEARDGKIEDLNARRNRK